MAFQIVFSCFHALYGQGRAYPVGNGDYFYQKEGWQAWLRVPDAALAIDVVSGREADVPDISPDMRPSFAIARHGKFWAVLELPGQGLVCVCTTRKGAGEVGAALDRRRCPMRRTTPPLRRWQRGLVVLVLVAWCAFR